MAQTKETAHEKFQRLSKARTERSVYHLLLLKNLASNDYENTPEEAEALIATIRAPVDEIAAAFGVNIERPSADPVPDSISGEPPQETAPGSAGGDSSLEEGEIKNGVLYEADFPNREENMMLLRLGPKLGKVMEALMDGESDLALKMIIEIMRS